MVERPAAGTIPDAPGSYQFFDADGHEAQDVFIDRQLTFHFLDRCGRRIDAKQGIVTLAVLLHPIGEVAQTPILDLGNGTAAFFDQSF